MQAAIATLVKASFFSGGKVLELSMIELLRCMPLTPTLSPEYRGEGGTGSRGLLRLRDRLKPATSSMLRIK